MPHKLQTRTMYLSCGCIKRGNWFATAPKLKFDWCVKHFRNTRVSRTYVWKTVSDKF